ncbi:hypothetical protein DMH27_00030 [Raoultella planticola]|nr:hypothetical protein [Raoultella planticola]
MYYFEEVEEKRAREREQLAARYQPIPEPASPVATRPVTPPPASPVEAAVTTLAAGVHRATSAGATAATVASAASSAAPLFSPASGGPRAQVKRGLVQNCRVLIMSASLRAVSWHRMVLNCRRNVWLKSGRVKRS